MSQVIKSFNKRKKHNINLSCLSEGTWIIT